MQLVSTPFSPSLQKKIAELSSKKNKTQLGSLSFSSKLLLAPMASICNAPFRLLMEDLGAGGTVSELISCHGINYGSQATLEMLRIAKNEKNIGLQLFGDDAEALARAAVVAESFAPKWIDLNMGCPVKKVVTKGGGSALLRDTSKLGIFFETIKKSIKVPFTIKIRIGWDQDELNAGEIIHIAQESGVEFVAIHGRTRAQQYTGRADWNFIENLCVTSSLPLIGNGDLHTSITTYRKLQETSCDALMLARGPLRNPFQFLESLTPEPSKFCGPDYWEVIFRLYEYYQQFFENERTVSIQLKKFIAWFAAGFPHAVQVRQKIFSDLSLKDSLNVAQDFFMNLGDTKKNVPQDDVFMTSGHG